MRREVSLVSVVVVLIGGVAPGSRSATLAQSSTPVAAA
jgi:hypothetical protein